MITQIFTDGGIIGKNPSAYGGVFAYVHVTELGVIAKMGSGIMLAANAPEPSDLSCYVENLELPTIENNLMEMIAVCEAFKGIPKGWKGKLYSDSGVTLGRLFEGWKWNGVPDRIRRYAEDAMMLRTVEGVLLSGHPSRIDLQRGHGKSGRPVSRFNVECDKECNRLARAYLNAIEA